MTNKVFKGKCMLPWALNSDDIMVPYKKNISMLCLAESIEDTVVIFTKLVNEKKISYISGAIHKDDKNKIFIINDYLIYNENNVLDGEAMLAEISNNWDIYFSDWRQSSHITRFISKKPHIDVACLSDILHDKPILDEHDIYCDLY